MNLSYQNLSYEYLLSMPSHRYKDKIDTMLGQLREKYGITFFYYQRRVDDEILLHIVGDRKWQMRYVSEYYAHDSFQKPEAIVGQDYYLWGVNPQSAIEKIMHLERTEVYGIPQGISFIRHHPYYTDTFSYSSNLLSRPIESIIANNQNLVKWENNFLLEIEFIFQEQRVTSLYKNSQDVNHLKLSDKETHAIQMLSNDLDTDEISRSLHVTQKTVQKIIDTAKGKLGCDTRTGLVAKALQLKIITPPIVFPHSIIKAK